MFEQSTYFEPTTL